MNVYRHLFDDEVYASYQEFTHLLFETYTDPGNDAKIRSVIHCSDGNRTKHSTYPWQEEWDASFTNADKVAPKSEVRTSYYTVMAALTNSLGIKR